MNPVRDIIQALETRIASVAPTYSKLPYVYDINKNTWKKSKLGFAVRPAGATETDSVTKTLTYLHEFEVVLTNGYVQSSTGDSSLQDAVTQLSDLIHSMFVDFENTRLGIPNTVLNVTGLAIDRPEVIDEEKVVALTASVTILYRLNT